MDFPYCFSLFRAKRPINIKEQHDLTLQFGDTGNKLTGSSSKEIAPGRSA
jgi:hypothetical protein